VGRVVRPPRHALQLDRGRSARARRVALAARSGLWMTRRGQPACNRLLQASSSEGHPLRTHISRMRSEPLATDCCMQAVRYRRDGARLSSYPSRRKRRSVAGRVLRSTSNRGPMNLCDRDLMASEPACDAEEPRIDPRGGWDHRVSLAKSTAPHCDRSASKSTQYGLLAACACNSLLQACLRERHARRLMISAWEHCGSSSWGRSGSGCSDSIRVRPRGAR
jgi:hypothetical protein